MDTEVRRLIAKLEAQRQAAMDMLMGLTDDQLDLPFDQAPTDEEGDLTVRRLMHRVITHHLDHKQHILKSRRIIEKPRTEVSRVIAQMQEARAQLIAALVGLTDEDIRKDVSEGHALGALTPRDESSEPEYTIKRIVEHVVDMENMRMGHIRQALDGVVHNTPAQ